MEKTYLCRILFSHVKNNNNMEKKFKRTTVTSALPYANGPVHIGHLAGVYVPADIYVRYLRLKKEDVIFIGGSDEHGVPITIRAKKEGCTPQDVVDRYHTLIRDSFKEFGISFEPPDGFRLLPQALRQGRIHRKDLHAILRRGS